MLAEHFFKHQTAEQITDFNWGGRTLVISYANTEREELPLYIVEVEFIYDIYIFIFLKKMF
jgi:hypothetical protein